MTDEKDPEFQQAPPNGYFKKRTVSDADAPDLAAFKIKPEQPANQNWLDPNTLNQGSPNQNVISQNAADQNTVSQYAVNQNAAGQISAMQNPTAADPASEEFLKNYLAKLKTEEAIKQAQNKGILYEPVGSIKFVLLCFCVPLHAYEFWWIYRNFAYQQKRSNDRSSPVWRVNMLLFYLRGLLNSMKDEGKLYGIENDIAVEKIILYWCMLFLCSIFPPPASILGMFSFAPLIYVNEYLIKLNKAANPDLPMNDKLTFSNWLIILAGASLFIFNTFMLPQLLSQLTSQLHF